MKYLFVLGVVCCTSLYALDPATVTLDEEFNVKEVVERLDEHMTNVETWYASDKQGVRSPSFDMELLRIAVQVTHPVLVECYARMELEKSLEPFFIIWNTFKSTYAQSSQDQLLCKEIAFLVMHLYSMMLNSLERAGTRVNVAQMLELYHLIAALPIYELLALLDSIARQIITILDQTYQGETSFFVWLWHNWWVPPTIISNTVSSLVDGITTIMTGQEPEESPDPTNEGKKSVMQCAT